MSEHQSDIAEAPAVDPNRPRKGFGVHAGWRDLAALRPLRSSLTLRVILAFVAFGMAVLVGVAGIIYYSGRVGLEREVVSSLTVLAAEKEVRLDGWFAQKVDANSGARCRPDRPKRAAALLTTARNGAEADAARARLGDFLSGVAVRTGKSFFSMFALDGQTGQILVATNAMDNGKFKEDRPYFTEGKKGAFVQGPYFSVPEGGPTVVFSAPINAADGKLLGVLAGRANIAELQAIASGPANARTTDDNFIVNRAGLFVTQPRFIPDRVVLRLGTQAAYLKDCLAGNSGADFTQDYRLVPVIAIHRWIAAGSLCLIVKVDEAEALAPVVVFRNAILFTAIVALIAALGISIVIGRSITRPSRTCRPVPSASAAASVTFVCTEGRRTAGVLAREFNRMTLSLSASELEQKRQAEALQISNVLLERANTALAVENTERRRAQDEVLALNQTLERRVAARSAEAARRPMASVETFAYAASHDLKAPLRVIDNASKWLEEDLAEYLTGENLENMQLLRGRVGRMERLLDDLAEYSRVGRATDGRYGEIVTGDVLMGNVLALLPPSEDFVIKISLGFARIQVCRMPLQQILINLGQQRHQASRQGDRVHRGDGGGCRHGLRICGQGRRPRHSGEVPGPDIQDVPDPQARDQVEGSGMGLAMVRKNIEVYGGTFSLDSVEGQGSVFRFTWPKHQQMTGAAA